MILSSDMLSICISLRGLMVVSFVQWLNTFQSLQIKLFYSISVNKQGITG